MKYGFGRLTSRRGSGGTVLVCIAFFGAAAWVGAQPVPPAVIVFVDLAATGANDGTNWGDAFVDLQRALDIAQPGHEIWVATRAEPYRPSRATDPADPRTATFKLPAGVAIYGGFAGTETERGQRDVAGDRTILSGDLEGDDPPNVSLDDLLDDPGRFDEGFDDNSYHVVTAAYDEGVPAVLDGFVIQAGLADDRYLAGTIEGGAIMIEYASPTIANCTLSRNVAVVLGGAVFVFDGDPTFINCTFLENVTTFDGGALSVWRGMPRLIDCTFIGNRAEFGGAIDLRPDAVATLTRCLFADNRADRSGGGLTVQEGVAALTDCVFIANAAGTRGGGVSSWNASITLTRCTFAGNQAGTDDEPGEGGGLSVWVHNADLTDCIFADNTAASGGEIACKTDATVRLLGDGTVAPGLTGEVTVAGRLGVGGRIVLARGTFTVTPTGEMVIEEDALVRLEGRGEIRSRGRLVGRDRATIASTPIEAAQAEFTGQATLVDNVITTRGGSALGGIFVKDAVQVVNNTIYASGDGYLDLDPETFAGTIADNRIRVTLMEGVGSERGGLLEARGLDQLPAGLPEGPGAFPLAAVPDFSMATWTFDEIRIVARAKVNLTGRFDSQAPFDADRDAEVVYVRDLVVGADSVLNVAFQRLYYERLLDEQGQVLAHPEDGILANGARIVNLPLLGFSLYNIDFSSHEEFLTRIRTNNDRRAGIPDRIHVRRVVGRLPDPTGMMQMINLQEAAGEVVHARAKGTFAKVSKDERHIRITFQYLFCSLGGKLAVSLSANPAVGVGNVEVAEIAHPSAGRPGSLDSGRFGRFVLSVDRGDLDFSRGVRIELELVGPAGTCVLIDDFDPHELVCQDLICGDVTGEGAVDFRDRLAVVGVWGKSADPSSGDFQASCADSELSDNGYIADEDFLSFDADENGLNVCDLSAFAAASGVGAAETGSATPTAGTLMVAGKRTGRDLEDYLFSFDSNGTPTGEGWLPCLAPDGTDSLHGNGRLLQDATGEVYQLNVAYGLSRLRDCARIVPPGRTPGPKETEVTIGLVPAVGGGLAGLPVWDAVVDREGFVYVVPVMVRPNGGGDAYPAAAKLRLIEGAEPPYEVEQLYGEPPAAPGTDNLDLQRPSQIEVDSVAGRVYVTSGYAWNENDWLLIFNADRGTKLSQIPLSPVGVAGPTALCLAEGGTTLYMAAARNAPTAPSTTVFRFATADLIAGLVQPEVTTITDMGHVTSITEDLATGQVWVAGFVTLDDHESPALLESITQARLATLPREGGDSVAASAIEGADLALPLSAVFVGIPPNQPGDMDGDGDVDLSDYVSFLRCFGPRAEPGCEDADIDGDGDVDLADLIAFQARFTGAR